jgi:hypothetical protein
MDLSPTWSHAGSRPRTRSVSPLGSQGVGATTCGPSRQRGRTLVCVEHGHPYRTPARLSRCWGENHQTCGPRSRAHPGRCQVCRELNYDILLSDSNSSFGDPAPSRPTLWVRVNQKKPWQNYGFGSIFIPMGLLMGINLYPTSSWVRVCSYSTQPREPIGFLNPTKPSAYCHFIL